MKKKKPIKDYEVDFDMKYSHSVIVKARTTAEAKAKAFDKFSRIRNKRSEYNVCAEVL